MGGARRDSVMKARSNIYPTANFMRALDGYAACIIDESHSELYAYMYALGRGWRQSPSRRHSLFTPAAFVSERCRALKYDWSLRNSYGALSKQDIVIRVSSNIHQDPLSVHAPKADAQKGPLPYSHALCSRLTALIFVLEISQERARDGRIVRR
jgi:hypothetical protein